MANAVGASAAVDSLEQLFVKANNDLTVVQHKLEIESEQRYPDKSNPLKLMHRIKNIQEELPLLKEQCEKLLAAKQDLIDKTQTMLVGNRALIQRLQVRTNIPVISDSDDPVYTSLETIIDEWNEQLGLKSNAIAYDNGSDALRDLNQKSTIYAYVLVDFSSFRCNASLNEIFSKGIETSVTQGRVPLVFNTSGTSRGCGDVGETFPFFGKWCETPWGRLERGRNVPGTLGTWGGRWGRLDVPGNFLRTSRRPRPVPSPSPKFRIFLPSRHPPVPPPPRRPVPASPFLLPFLPFYIR
ncbi:hypothetical protein KI387_008377 [Taxus chinensis]|uniref:Protein FAM33A n=1 Tax=Taxus chinensis TaxID=29808 RepID=A0AA38CSE4_TAXCH|nr:hypothetical protein KI387_008377 [Taxus chinensis]